MKSDKIRELRGFCESAIILKVKPFEQINAALGIYEPARCEAIKNYIAACRNEYLRCKALILAATSNEMADSVQFIAPHAPENL